MMLVVYGNYQYIRRRVVVYLDVFGDALSGSLFDFENLTQSEAKEHKWPQKCDGGPYNGADSVNWTFIYIYIK